MAKGELVHAVTHVIRTHRLDRFSRRELAVAILDEVEPLIRADERAKCIGGRVYQTELGWVAADAAGWTDKVYKTEAEARAALIDGSSND
jgi:hypothetical protein